MSDTFAAFASSAAVQIADSFAKTRREEARYAYLSGGRSRGVPSTDPSTSEVVLPGVKLNNYTERTVTEDGDHVLIVEHKEHLEKKPEPEVPPTPEELAQAREEKRFMAKLWAGVAAVGIVVTGAVIIAERHTKTVVETVI